VGRLHLTPGTRYLQDTHIYVVRQLLLDGRLLVENQSIGGQAVVTHEDLCATWARGALTFAVPRIHAHATPETPLPTAYTIADFHLLPEVQRAEAWRRYTLIRPLLALPPRERTRRAITRYLSAERLHHARGPGGADQGAAASAAIIERYLRAFDQSAGDIRALVPATARRGGGGSRLARELEQIVQGVLAECRAAPTYRTVRDVHFMIITRVAAANRDRPATDQLPLPAQNTIYRRVRSAGPAAILRRRPSQTEAQATKAVHPGPRPARPLERVEIDHTPLDLLVVDEEDRLPIGRPTLTLALDRYSGFPTGLHVGFEPASYVAAMRCLAHSILPKEDTRARYGAKNLWPVYGVPEVLVVDHAPHLIGADLRDACGQLGIHLDPAPVRRPWFKGAIERQFRTHNTGLVHTLPGTTFSNLLERGDDDPARHACISLRSFWEILHIYLLDFYAQDWHDGIDGVPAQRWAEKIASGWRPALHHNASEVRILLGRTAVRTIQRTGIEHLCLRYQSADLDALRRALPAAAAVRVKYDPEDLGVLYVHDPTRDAPWLAVPATDQGYAGGLSLWKHRVVRAYVRRTMKQAVDVGALAAAKARIQEIVTEEFRHTRTTRRRVAAARFLGAGTTGAPALPDPPRAIRPPAEDSALPSARNGPAAGARDLPDPMATSEAGWGADYGLPRVARRDPLR